MDNQPDSQYFFFAEKMPNDPVKLLESVRKIERALEQAIANGWTWAEVGTPHYRIDHTGQPLEEDWKEIGVFARKQYDINLGVFNKTPFPRHD